MRQFRGDVAQYENLVRISPGILAILGAVASLVQFLYVGDDSGVHGVVGGKAAAR